jgi:two-component system, NtrC family, response regulator AtoC
MVRRVMVLGPDDETRRTLHVLATKSGLAVAAADDLETARKHLASSECDVVLAVADLAPGGVAELARAGEGPPVIAIVKTRDVGAAVALLQAGAIDVITEPVDELALTLALRKITVVRRARRSTNNGAASIAEPTIIGDGPAMQKLKATVRLVAPQRTTVLILGESGTGKELVAKSIHLQSPRRAQKFVAINCAAIPPNLLESELFGHTRGAFTDAVRDKIGLFEEADGGTLFLDEVGELPQPLQAKLLRALQESEIRRVGDNESIKIDVRLVAATLRDLSGDVAAGRFREDLYYRLNVLPIAIPALRERPEDIPDLVRYFVAQHAGRHQRTVQLSDAAIALLAAQPWPGNVRELENVLERAVVLTEKPVVDVDVLATLMRIRASSPQTVDHELSIKKATRSLEQDLIKRALGVTQGNRTNAAKLLEISHRALLYKMKEYGIS